MPVTPAVRRWLRFNTVGAAGAAVQLIALWLMVRSGVPEPMAAAFAVEAAVIHNFFWHESWTWGGSSRCGNALGRFARFNVSNGAISIVGNAIIMWILATQLGLPYLPVNLVSILVCSGLNFVSSDRFVFRSHFFRDSEPTARLSLSPTEKASSR